MVDDASNVATGPAGATGPTGATGITDEQKTKGAVAYIFGWLTGVIILVIGGQDKYLKFHALQSIVYSVAVCILAVILMIISFIISILISFVAGGLGCCFTLIIYLIILVLCLYSWYGAYMVYTTGAFRIPMIADFVEKNLLK